MRTLRRSYKDYYIVLTLLKPGRAAIAPTSLAEEEEGDGGGLGRMHCAFRCQAKPRQAKEWGNARAAHALFTHGAYRSIGPLSLRCLAGDSKGGQCGDDIQDHSYFITPF